MLEDFELYTTLKVRCLVYQQRISDDLYLMLCGVEDCLPDYYFNAAGRDGYHLHVVLKGRGVLSVNGRETELHFGQMFITKPGEDTWYRADSNDPWTYCWMTFGGRLAKECAEEAGFIDGVNVLDCHVDELLSIRTKLYVSGRGRNSPAVLPADQAVRLRSLRIASISSSVGTLTMPT